MRVFLNRINIFLIVVYLFLALPKWAGYLRPVKSSFPGSFIEKVRQQSQEKAAVRRVNLLMPASYETLLAFSRNANEHDSRGLLPYIGFYRALADFLPQPLSGDAHALLGFCYVHQKDLQRARHHFREAVRLNPLSITPRYNQGLLEFQAQNYDMTIVLVSELMAVGPQAALQAAVSSKIYIDILRQTGGLDLELESRETLARAMRLLVISQYKTAKYSEIVNASRFAVESGLGPREFFQFYALLAMSAQKNG